MTDAPDGPRLNRAAVEQLQGWWSQAAAAGIGGTGAFEEHRQRAEAFAAVLSPTPARFVDLGTGPGMPGLALALLWPDASAVLVDASERRIGFVERWLRELGLADRVRAVHGRAEVLARDEELRHGFDVVTARSFGAPAVTAECGTGFLVAGGHLAVSEPPPDSVTDDRWPTERLERLGLADEGTTRGIRVLCQTAVCGEDWPRRTGVPERRPLW